MRIPPEQRELARMLFAGALEREPTERASYLENACPGDPQLREHIFRMVDTGEKNPGFLETPALTQVLSCPLLEPGDLVEGRYRIVRLAGIGGMGEVYEAEDAEAGERIALKLIRRDLIGVEETAARLRREILLVHKIAHPNVCKIHYLGVDRRPEGSVLFLTMDFLEGESLSDRLERNGPLSSEAALSIAQQIAAGLDAAHQEGVIHQDLKSSNVMLVPRKDGTTRAVITDFGIASRTEEDLGPGPGTPAYMPPERMRETTAKPSADIYSFGVILYQMVTGRMPFESGTPLERKRKLPPPPSTLRRELKRKWDRAILRCLDPVPEERYARGADVVDALKPARWPVAAMLALLIVPGGYWLVPRVIAWTTAGPVQSVAFLPFEVAAPPELKDDLPAGLTDYLAEQIQQNPIIRKKWLIFSPAEVHQMRVMGAAQASTVLGATHALTGTITRDTTSVTIVGELVDAKSFRRIASFQKTCRVASSVCLQDGMTQAIAGILVLKSLSSPPLVPISNEALVYYLQGLDFLRRDSISYGQAIPLLEQAIAKDPAAAQPRVALADAHMLRFRAMGDKSALDSALSILAEVLRGYPDLAEAHSSLGSLYRIEGHYDDASRQLLLALQADPFNHSFHRRLALSYDKSGREADATVEFEKAIVLQPRDWASYLDYAVFHWSHGRFAEATALLERFLSWAPDHSQILAALGGIYVDMGRNSDALRVSNRSCQLRPDSTCYANAGIALQRQQRTEEAIAKYRLALDFGAPSEMLLLNTADAYAFLGDSAHALEFFRRAADRALESLKINVQNGSSRAILAYCKAQMGDREGALSDLEQALGNFPTDKNVRKYGVLTYESLGDRAKALATLRGATRQVLSELELAPGTERLRQDPLYPALANEIRNR